MVVALGEAYDKLDRLQEAKKCFWKAHALGDMEGLALIKLAKYVLMLILYKSHLTCCRRHGKTVSGTWKIWLS